MTGFSPQFILFAREEGAEQNKKLDGEIDAAQSRLSGLLLFPALFVSFCSVCLVAEGHKTHILKEDVSGSVYRSMHCGHRTARPAMLRLVGPSVSSSYWFKSLVYIVVGY